MDIVLNGVVSGLVLAMLIGPVFFTIIQTSIERGFVSGVLIAAGVSLSDTLYILLTYLGLSQLLNHPDLKVYLAYCGGIILLMFGGYHLFIKSRRLVNYDRNNIQYRSPLRYLAKGFVINGMSPMVLIFWLGTVGFATTDLGYDTAATASVFFGAVLVTVFITDVVKAKLADKLRLILTPRLIRIMNLVLGIVLVIFGGRMIFMADSINLLQVISPVVHW